MCPHAVALRWRDLDAFNHVNNSNFLTYLEEARIRWFASWNGEWVNDVMAPLLAAVQLNYGCRSLSVRRGRRTPHRSHRRQQRDHRPPDQVRGRRDALLRRPRVVV
jgi:hypothetical protein